MTNALPKQPNRPTEGAASAAQRNSPQRRYNENPQSCVNEVDESQRNRTDSEADAFPNKFIEILREISDSHLLPQGALKKLLPIDEAINAKTALGRMKAELETLKSVSHPALIRVLDDHVEERWFVTEYFENGPFDRKLDRFKGRVLLALKAYRPIVDAVAALHTKSIVHRDIKPDNVFIANDESLVLGDCGLAIKLDKQERLTLTYENVGTRDYQPPWSYGMRLEDVKPQFDVFSLGKLLWAMVSGKPRFPLWYFNRQPHDLRLMFPNNSDVLLVHRVLEKTVVEHEEACKLLDAGVLLEEVDRAIRALEIGGQVPGRHRLMECRFCGVGRYQQQGQFRNDGFRDPQDRRYYYRCDNCGHLESFFFQQDRLPPGWSD